MKALKIILGIVLLLVVAVVVMALIAPKHTHLERSVVIDAPMEYIHPQISELANMHEWSPWAELDPDQKITYEGEDGSVGAVMHWEGNDKVGVGSQEITAIAPDHIETKLSFKEPYESEATAALHMEEVEGGTQVTWSFDSDTPFPWNAMNLFMDMEKMLGPDFEKGMNNLEERVESMKAERTEFDGFSIKMEELPMRMVIGKRDTVSWNDMHEFYTENLQKAYKAVAKSKLEMAGMPCGVYFQWDEENQQADLLAGVPVTGGEVKGMDKIEVGGSCLVIDYYGPYEGTGKAHEAMDAYIKWHGMEVSGPVVEEYVTDPQEEPDQSKWLTKVIYPVKKSS